MGKVRPLADRFNEKCGARTENGCIPWTGATDGRGYGQIGIGQRSRRAPRVAWELAHGQIADGLHVLHRCDNPGCVNVEHLFLGTHMDNMRDRDAKGRTKAGISRGERHGTHTHPESKTVGEKHWSARLTEAKAREILRRARSGELPEHLAHESGVNPSTIQRLVAGHSWKHLHGGVR